MLLKVKKLMDMKNYMVIENSFDCRTKGLLFLKLIYHTKRHIQVADQSGGANFLYANRNNVRDRDWSAYLA